METLTTLWNWLASFDNIFLATAFGAATIVGVILAVFTAIAIVGYVLWHLLAWTVFSPTFWVVCAMAIILVYAAREPDRTWMEKDLNADFISACSSASGCRENLKQLDDTRPEEKNPDAYRPLSK